MGLTTAPRLRLQHVVIGSAVALGAAAVVAGAGYGLTARVGVGAGLVPAVAGGLLLLGAAAWCVELGVARLRTGTAQPTTAQPSAAALLEDLEDDDAAEPLDRSGALRVVVVLGALTATAALFDVLGFALSTFLMLLVLLRGVSRRSWRASLITAVAASLLARLVFEDWLDTALPHSVLPLVSGWGL